MVSECTMKMFEKCGIKVGVMKKLVTTLKKKVKYVIHYRNLKLYQRLSLR